MSSGLTWIQTVSHSDGIPDRNLQKVDYENISRCQESMQNYPSCKEFNLIHSYFSYFFVIFFFFGWGGGGGGLIGMV